MRYIRKVVTSIQRAFRKLPKSVADKLLALALLDIIKQACGFLVNVVKEVIDNVL